MRKLMVVVALLVVGLFCISRAFAVPEAELVASVRAGDRQKVEHLLAGGVSPDSRDGQYGLTALMCSTGQGDLEIIDMLIQAGADLEARDSSSSFTALIWAAWWGRSGVASRLLRAGARVNARSDNHVTALMMAAYKGHLDDVRCLLEAGADVHARMDAGWTALLFARDMGHEEIAALLENAESMLPEPLLFGGNVEIKESRWREGARSVIVRALDLDFQKVEVDFTVSDWERRYFEKNDFSAEDVREFKEQQAYQQVLWCRFANQPEVDLFDPITTEDWYEKWCCYRDGLVVKAQRMGLPAESLRRCLASIESDPEGGTAYLPVGAHRARTGEHPVWIIVCKWEYARAAAGEGGAPVFHRMGHFHAWAIDERDLSVVADVRCGIFPFLCQ